MKHIIYSFLVIFALLLSGCADAGKDQTVNAGETVTLDASASTPGYGGEIKKYRWKQVKHRHVPKVTLSDKKSISPTFIAPNVTTKTKLTFRLKTVEKAKYRRKFRSYDFVHITILPESNNTDTTPPVITLEGDNPVIHNMYPEGNNLYVDAGASATDDVDGDITSKIITDLSNIDLHNEGNYTVTYNVSDEAGNEAQEVTRTVIVIDNTPDDTTAPVITLNGGDVTLTVGDTYTEQGAIATDNIDGNVEVSITGNVDTTTAGTYTVTYTATDTAGNSATKTRTITVLLPNHAPTADDLTISISKNQSVDVNVTAEDSDGDTLMYQLHMMPDHGTLTGELPNVVFTPDVNYVGQDSFTFSATDGQLLSSNEANVSITIADDTTTSITITGQITNIEGSAIIGASVTVGEKSTSTDNNGSYSISGIESSERITVNVTHPDYLTNSKVVVVAENKDFTLDIKLGTPKATLSFASTDGAMISSADGASVELPADGYVDANGTAYTGDVSVKMSYYPITTRSGRATFPGTFEGIDSNGSTFPIQSYGFMNVELTDPQGNPLNLDGNSTATLNFPRDNNIYPQPITIPLWYYDEAQGYWLKEGEAIRTSDYTHYVGTVTHFTSWNLDAKGPRARFTGCVEDVNGTKMNNAQVQFSSDNWDSYSRPTDENGSISVINILAQTNLNFGAYKVINGSIYYGDKTIYLSEGQDKVDNACVVLSQQGSLPNTITVHGVILDDRSHANEDIYLAPTGTSNILSQTQVDSTGRFTFTFQPSDSLSYTVGQSFDGPLYGRRFLIRPNKNIYSITIDRRPQ